MKLSEETPAYKALQEALKPKKKSEKDLFYMGASNKVN